MNQSNNIQDYSIYGGTSVEEEPESPKKEIESSAKESKASEKTVDYSQYGGDPVEPPKEKAGKFKSALYGLAEGVLGPASLIYEGKKAIGKGVYAAVEKILPGDKEEKSQEKELENPFSEIMGEFPESEGQAARRIRVGAQALPASAAGGIPGIIMGLVGSQAGQTVREVFGKEGKFDEFGWGEGAAIGADILSGFGAGLATSLVKAGTRTAQEAPSIFRNATTGLQRKITQNAIQAEENVLKDIVNNFSKSQLKGFEEQAAQISPQRFTDLTQSNAAGLKRQADNMFRNTQLSIISPIAATPEQGGRALQEAANVTFRNEVLGAEREAYAAARESAEGVTGHAPRTIEEAKALRAALTKNEPTPEQKPLIAFLDGLISDLETTTEATTKPASRLLNAQGEPITGVVEVPATSQPTTRSANDLIDLVQKSNQAVNYGGELREQSHRLAPLVATLREEVAAVLAKNPEAAALYQEANQMHGRNAQVWGTRYMRNLRFAENPESIIGQTKKASNMRNLKQGIQNPAIQALGERLVVEQITEGGSASSNRTALNHLAPELSPNARTASEQLINVKDPLTTTGGRAAVRNDILKDAAQSVNTGKRPEKILELMQTPKGYQIVRESLNGTPQSRELFSSFERLFMEDLVSSFTDKTGAIDFVKAQNIFKNPEVRNVVQQIGGERLVRRFEQLETFANNFQKNQSLYAKPETQSLFKRIKGEVRDVGLLTAILHSFHVPWPIISGLGLSMTGAKVGKMTYNTLQRKILSNPKAVHYLEKVSQATTTEELTKQLPRLIAELNKETD